MFENNNLTKFKPYTLTSHKAWEIENKSSVLKIDWNEATIPPSPLVINRLINALKNEKLNWYPNINNTILIEKLAIYSNVNPRNIQYFASSDAIHEHIIRAFINKNDKVLIVSPTYDNFRADAEMGGAIIDYFFLDENFILNIKDFEEVINNICPKLIYIVNPNNPTGNLIPLELLENLTLKFNNTLFIIDEAYFEFTGISLSEKSTKSNNIIITRTFSKAFALASFRIGYVISNHENISILNKIRNAKNISLMAQIAAEAALDSFEYTKTYIDEINKSRDFLITKLKTFDFLTPFQSHANFVLVKIYSIDTKKKFIEFLEKDLIFIRDYGHIDHMKNFIRLTVGTKIEMEKLIISITNFKKTVQ